MSASRYCPVAGCAMLFQSSNEAAYHMNQQHGYSIQPAMSTANRNNTPPQFYTQPSEITRMQPPPPQPHTPGNSFRRPEAHAPVHQQPIRPNLRPSQPPEIQTQQSQPQNPRSISHHENTVKEVDWHPAAEGMLRSLLWQNSLFRTPQTQEERQILAKVMREFIRRNGFAGWTDLPADSPMLSIIFEKKVQELQVQLVQEALNGNGRQSDMSRRTPRAATMVEQTQKQTQKQTQISTPPLTPVISPPHGAAILNAWTASDADAQIDAFRQILKTAKDPMRMKLVWNAYCEDSGMKGDKTTPVGVVRQSVEHNQGATPSDTPPMDGRSGSLKQMIEARLEECRKRQREQEALEKSTNEQSSEPGESAKRTKIEPIVVSP